MEKEKKQAKPVKERKPKPEKPAKAPRQRRERVLEALGVVGAPPLGLRYLRIAGRDTPTASASSCMLTALPWELLPFMR